MSVPGPVLFESHVNGLQLLARGKVRDIYAVDDEHLLLVASDRLSAFDVVLPDPIPGKGEVLTRLSRFWFERMRDLVPGQDCDLRLEDVVADAAERALLATRSMLVRRFRPLPVEAVVRGYLIGSGWKDYQASGSVSGIRLPAGLRQGDKLPASIFTPSTKAAPGEHDRSIDFDAVVALVGGEMAARVRDIAIAIYERAAAYAREHGIIIADTKFEFGLDKAGDLHLIDEVLTPDSSRFWPAEHYRPGISPPSFDKQYVRDYLETLDWPKRPPAPSLPGEVIERTARKYQEARERLEA